MVESSEHHQILATGQNLINRSILTNQSDVLAHLSCVCRDIKPCDARLTFVEFKQGGQNFHRRSLARPIGTEKPTDCSGLHLKIEPVERSPPFGPCILLAHPMRSNRECSTFHKHHSFAFN